jgi:hypothetical protein
MLAMHCSTLNNKPVFWFNLIGALFGFIGSVIFSAGLVKSVEQVQDENSTYYDGNPYTMEYALRSRKSLIAGFLLLISGFSVSIGGVIGDRLGTYQVLVGLLISVGLTAVGFLGTALLYMHNRASHDKLKYTLAKKLYKSTLQQGLYGRKQANVPFEMIKTSLISDLDQRFNALPPHDRDLESALISDIKQAKDLDAIESLCSKFLEQG